MPPSFLPCTLSSLLLYFRSDFLSKTFFFSLDEHYFQKYMELIHLMRVPVIREVIFGKLVEMKKIAKDEIEAFRSDRIKKQEKSIY